MFLFYVNNAENRGIGISPKLFNMFKSAYLKSYIAYYFDKTRRKRRKDDVIDM